MPTEAVLQLLYAERDKINRAIAVLEGGGNGAGIKRRGRPPKSAMTMNGSAPAIVKRKPRSLAQRKAQAARMKKYWAAKKAAAKKPAKKTTNA